MNTINKIDTEVMLTMEELTKAFTSMVESPGDTPTYPDLMEGADGDDGDDEDEEGEDGEDDNWNDDPFPEDQYPEGPIPQPPLKTPIVQI